MWKKGIDVGCIGECGVESLFLVEFLWKKISRFFL
jgi:hypothetical protein